MQGDNNIDIDVEENIAKGKKEFPHHQGCNPDKSKTCVGAWFRKFVVLHLLSFAICLCSGINGESCDRPSNKRVPTNMEFEVANNFWKVVIFLHFGLHHLHVTQKNNELSPLSTARTSVSGLCKLIFANSNHLLFVCRWDVSCR